ncbi:glycosyltransferase [Amphritea japonica]|uniref:Glycosyl transferase family 2 n=1 Tax=Amphritea japonica ATCC BAA-1530 TaxID=1278309 RepID=A0A7R6P1F5_9GAMM|nr:glycosyltransferase [Amphritea japonica]BBB25099.1 glycosyl transferase family 2 [Amphritea japonica ATCC BAA-1530]
MIKEQLCNVVNSLKKMAKAEELLVGHIDYINGQNIGGWAASEITNRTVNVGVLCNGSLIAKGDACLYREDVKDHGIHAGEHGFNLFISEDELPENCELHLVDMESMKIIKEVMINDLNCENLFIVDGQIKLSSPINIKDEDSEKVSIENVSDFLEGIGGENKGDQESIIMTPWMYLKDSANTPGFMSMNVHSNKRFESLRFHIDALAKGSHYLTADKIGLVHQLVVEGYENRNKYPRFTLPFFEDPKVSVIVPAYNKFNLSYHCIASIALAFNKVSYEVILADDCSTDETANAENIIDNLVVSRNTENLRFLKSCNRASEIAKGEYIVFLNNDTEVTSFWLDELTQKILEDVAIGMTGSKLLNLDGTLQEAGGIVWESGEPWNVGRNENPMTPEFCYSRDVDYLTGAAMCVRKDVWEKVDKFSEELAPCYYEDTDFAFKVREAGFRTVYVPYSEVIHFEGQSHGTDVTKGLKRYQKVNEKTFRSKWFKKYRNNGTPSLINMQIEKDRKVDQRILVLDYATPVPSQDAGSYAAIEEIKLIISLGFKVTFVPENLAHFGKYTKALQKMGVEVLYAPFYTSMDNVFDRRLAEMDAVYVTRYHVAEKYIDRIKQQKNIKVIFNNADLHFLRELRKALQEGEKELDGPLRTRDNELAVCRKVDAILCYNTTEHAVITSHILDSSKMHLTPWVLQEKVQGPGYEERKGIAFLGGFNHTPNGEAVEYLVNEIMPLLALKRPEIVLYVYGSNMPSSYKKMEVENVKMLGFAETLDGVYHDHRIFVAPLLSGAGIKGKVLESMAYNLPTVLTEVAAEGTGLTQGISTLIAQDPQEWVDAIIKLYDNQLLWTKFAENSQTLVEEKYSFEHGHKVFKDIFASVGIYSSK